MDYTIETVKDPITHRTKRRIIPTKRMLLDRNAAAAVFTLVGFNENGLMPYKPFISRLCSGRSRLAGMSMLLDNFDKGESRGLLGWLPGRLPSGTFPHLVLRGPSLPAWFSRNQRKRPPLPIKPLPCRRLQVPTG